MLHARAALLPTAVRHGSPQDVAPSGGARAQLALLALGVVYGDIGTSPLYALRECFVGHGLAVQRETVLGVVSLIFWAVMLVVSFKYVTIILRADNDGEGGSLALLAQVSDAVKGRMWVPVITILGIFAAALFYGDSMITPAISVLSAVEGLKVALPDIDMIVIPLTLAILIVLFVIQRQGTHRIGILFGPIMILWFISITLLGLGGIARYPSVLKAMNPWFAVDFFLRDGVQGFLILGSVVLVVVVFLLFGYFRSFPLALQVMLNIPLALMGGLVFTWYKIDNISIATLVGFIAVGGVAARNGIMMISHYLHLMKHEGEAFTERMIERGTLERFVPVTMTALSAGIALIPFVRSLGQPGKEILSPVAICIVGGLITSTLLDFAVTPAVFRLFGKKAALQALRLQAPATH